MLLFTRLGRMSLLQHPIDTNLLQIYLQKQDQVDRLVAMLDEIGREQHQVQTIFEGEYRFQIIARKATVANARSAGEEAQTETACEETEDQTAAR